MSDGAAEALRFLQILYTDKAEADYVVIWTKHPDKSLHTFCFRVLDEAAERGMKEVAVGADVWFRVCPIYLDLTGKSGRGKKHETSCMPGVWLDLDVAAAGHKKLNLFPTKQAARDFLVEIDLPPTIVNDTGGGLQAYFLYERMLRFQKPEDNILYDRLSMGFQQKVAKESKERLNTAIDITGDIARVLRLPGTINQKPEYNKPRVEIIEYNPGNILSVDQLMRFVNLAPAELMKQPSLVEPIPDLVPKSVKLPENCALLMDLSPRFKSAMYREPGILPGKDSDSEYDQSISSQCGHAKIPQADCARAIAWSQRNFGKDRSKQKWRRHDYMERTIRRGYANINANEPALEYFAAKEEETAEEPKPKDDREWLLEQVSAQLGIDIIAVWEFPGEIPNWQIELEDGRRVMLGSPQKMMNWNHFNAVVFAVTHTNIKRMKMEQLLAIMELLGKLVVTIDIGELAHDQVWLKSKISEYVWAARTIDYEQDPAMWSGQPQAKVLKHDGQDWILLESFTSWLFHQNPQLRQPSRQEWGPMLKGCGLNTKQILMKREGGSGRQWFWSVPKKLIDE